MIKLLLSDGMNEFKMNDLKMPKQSVVNTFQHLS